MSVFRCQVSTQGHIFQEELAYPDVEVEVLVCHGFDVETDGWNSCYHLSYLCRVNQLLLAVEVTSERWLGQTLSLYKSVVLPALSCSRNHQRRRSPLNIDALRTKPRISILISFFAQRRPDSHDMPWPMFANASPPKAAPSSSQDRVCLDLVSCLQGAVSGRNGDVCAESVSRSDRFRKQEVAVCERREGCGCAQTAASWYVRLGKGV